VPSNKSGFAGVTLIETRVAFVTVRVPNPAIPDHVALMVEEPVARPVANPGPEIVTTFVLEEDQTAEAVTSLLDPSL
jgi:hypothetical protein